MGIDVHKAMGYGLTNVECDGYVINDARINPDSPLLSWDAGATLESYLSWCERQPRWSALMERTLVGERRMSPAEAVIHDSEYGMSSVLLIRPVWLPGWTRRGNALDWVEETHLRAEPQENWVRELESGIYPFSDTWMSAETGERLPGIDEWVRLHRRRHELKDPANAAAYAHILDAAAAVGGLRDDQQAQEVVVPHVPEEIRALIEWGELLTGNDTWKQLRPLFYTYWG